MTFKAKVVADIAKDTELTLQDLISLLESGEYKAELIPSWDASYEPTIIITGIVNKLSN